MSVFCTQRVEVGCLLVVSRDPSIMADCNEQADVAPAATTRCASVDENFRSFL